jgi:hypothetical protein
MELRALAPAVPLGAFLPYKRFAISRVFEHGRLASVDRSTESRHARWPLVEEIRQLKPNRSSYLRGVFALGSRAEFWITRGRRRAWRRRRGLQLIRKA